MTAAEIADRLFRRDEAWLRANMPPDFPRPDPVYGLWHVEAVESWARRRWGLIAEVAGKEDAQAVLRGRLRGKGPAAKAHGGTPA